MSEAEAAASGGRAARDHQPARLPLLRPRPAGDRRRRVRRAVPRAAGARGRSTRSCARPTRRRSASARRRWRGSTQVRHLRADALAGQRARRGRAAGLGPAQPAAARGQRARRRAARATSSSPRSTASPSRSPTATACSRVGATRGNGEVGEDVTANLRTIGSLPLRLRGDATRRRSSRCAARSTCRSPRSRASTRRASRPGCRRSSTRATPPPAPSASSIRRSPPRGRSTCGATRIGYSEGLDLPDHHSALEWLRGAGLPRQPATSSSVDGIERGRPRRAARWEERRGELDYDIDGAVVKVDSFALQRGAGQRRPRPALGDRLQVRADHGDHAAAQHRGQRRAHRRAHAVRRARAGVRRRRHRGARHAAQRGRHPPQGHPPRRRRDRAARRRRDPAGRRRR